MIRLERSEKAPEATELILLLPSKLERERVLCQLTLHSTHTCKPALVGTVTTSAAATVLQNVYVHNHSVITNLKGFLYKEVMGDSQCLQFVEILKVIIVYCHDGMATDVPAERERS